jgi:hypothetical protein
LKTLSDSHKEIYELYFFTYKKLATSPNFDYAKDANYRLHWRIPLRYIIGHRRSPLDNGKDEDFLFFVHVELSSNYVRFEVLSEMTIKMPHSGMLRRVTLA